jgi:hypothetical protein
VAPTRGCAALGVEHLAHRRRLGPHALADLRLSGEAARSATSTLRSSYVVSQVCDRWSPLGTTGPASKSVWISSPVRSEEAGVDEDDPVGRRAMQASEVRRGPLLLVHDADLEGGRLQAERLLHAANSSTDSDTSSGPCIFGFTM